MRSRLSGGLAVATLAAALLFALPASASHIQPINVTASTQSAGVAATYTFRITPSNNGINPGANPIPSGQGLVRIQFPAGYDLSGATFNVAASGIGSCGSCEPTTYSAFPAHTVTIDAATRVVTISNIAAPITDNDTGFQIIVAGVRNPAAAGNYGIPIAIQYDAGSGPQPFSASTFPFSITVPPGVNLDTASTAALYAREIIATPAAPATLVNNAGALNLNVPLRHSFSTGEVRYVRLECPGVLFANNSSVAYAGGGAASTGAINGLGSSAIFFSITSNGGVVANDRLVINGDRLLTSTQPVSCTYGLYDEPSQAAAGGAGGRIATLSGSYINFATSTAFTSAPRTSIANVEANPSYTAFVANAPTTTTTAALARVTYTLASPTPRKLNGTPITLADLHATGASGTRIVVSGNFAGAADANGSYASGTALARVYISTNNANCTFGTAATSVTANSATFNVGATALDRLICYAPRAGFVIPDATYTAVLDAVSAAPAVYAVDDIGPVNAGAIVRNGTQLQAPMINLPQGYVSRVALTNTGSTARRYTLTVLPYEGSPANVNTAALNGTIPANGGTVVELKDVITSFGGVGATRAVVLVTIEGPNGQIQGQYQIVNPASGGISNYVMVRPGTN